MKKILIPLCCAALSASALEVSAWRGETVSAWVPAGEKIAHGPSAKGGSAFSKKAAAAKKAAKKVTKAK